ncbi:MAG: FAD-dependent oxidoreductase [Gemmatimonadota bacterium]|nr:FAD-dependent oxidoreductase [Gemmatimonadota bacterium]
MKGGGERSAAIGIVGGGLTGLALAHELSRRDVPHLVFEASDRPGGVVRSERVEGRLLEWGPQRGRLTEGLLAYVRELALEDELITAPPGLPLYVYADGALREVPFSAWEFVTGDLLSWRAKLRVPLEVFTRGPDPRERVADFFVRKIGREAYERIVGPLYGGLYASDPADMEVGLSVGHVLREFGIERSLLLPLLWRGGSISPPAACSFREGMQTLTEALFEAHRERIRLSSPVLGLRPAGERGEGWTLELEDGEVTVHRVVLTCPAGATAGILETAASGPAERIASLNYNPLGVVHLHADTDLEGLGYQVSLAEDLATRGVTWNDSLFDRDGVYTVYLGGAKDPEVVDRPDDRLGAVAAREFASVTGFEARVLSVEREAMPAWDVSWRAIQGLDLPDGIVVAANWESRPGIPGRLHQARQLAERFADGG